MSTTIPETSADRSATEAPLVEPLPGGTNEPSRQSIPTDGDLIGRFAQARDEAAFAQLVHRHGPLVTSICRRILRQSEDGEDVFQATFLALAREAPRVRWQSSLAGWIYKVAYRSALRVRAQRAARKEHPVENVAAFPDHQLDEVAELDAQQRLYDELLELPTPYRDAIVVCCLEGHTRDQAARQLGCSEMVLKGRLQRGRQMLLRRLGMHGLLITSALAAAQQSVQAAEAAVTPELVAGATESAITWASGKAVLSTLLSNPTAYPQGAWIAMAQTPVFKGLLIGVCSVLVLCGSVALVGGKGGYGSLASGIRVQAAEQAGGEAESEFLALAGEDETKEKAAANDPARAAHAGHVDPRPSPAKAAAGIQKAMEGAARMEFIETPLTDVIEFLKAEHNVPFVLDKSAFEEEGVDSGTPITMNVAGITLRSALNLMLEPLHLKTLAKNEVLLITSERKADSEVTPRHYRVGDILEIDGGTVEELTDAIRTTIAPKKWSNPDNSEAPGQIKSVGKTLVILQSEEIHDQIAKLLEEMRTKK